MEIIQILLILILIIIILGFYITMNVIHVLGKMLYQILALILEQLVNQERF